LGVLQRVCKDSVPDVGFVPLNRPSDPKGPPQQMLFRLIKPIEFIMITTDSRTKEVFDLKECITNVKT